mmetsp:Transcript_47996/g.121832  ORF Transcript_47996/g.121832 Transcript_47996/m.121832 type:complete len:146 (-) Transcript_47996:50-487(-)
MACATPGPMHMIAMQAWYMAAWQTASMCACARETSTKPKGQPLPGAQSPKNVQGAAKQRPKGPLAPPVSVQPFLTSVGSIGHPDTCSAACRFAHTKEGCKLGAQCTYCHHCVWSDTSQASQAAPDGGTPPAMSEPSPAGPRMQYQ